MSTDPTSAGDIGARVRAALDSADPTAFRELLDPKVQWGAPDDDVSGCHNRDQVLAWYERSRKGGVRAEVTEVVVGDGKLLVGLRMSGRPTAEANRWQVLTIKAGLVIDIRAFDDRDEAADRAGVIGSTR